MPLPARKPSPPPVEKLVSTTAKVASRNALPEPPFRCLRAFSIDPSLATAYETASISEVIMKVPWERLEAGPRGEYLRGLAASFEVMWTW